MCTEQNNVHPIIVNEVNGVTVSVELYDKKFTDDEIVKLKTLNGSSNETTYQIFKSLDAKTRACKHTLVESNNEKAQYDSEDTTLRSGVRFYDSPSVYKIQTWVKGMLHGVYFEINKNGKSKKEYRNGVVDGIGGWELDVPNALVY